MKKKCIISLIVIFALTLTSFTAFAANKDELLSNDNIFICEDSNGIYKASKTGMSSETIKILPDTQFDNIYSTPSKEQYYQKIDDNEFIKVSKVEFDLTDYDAYTNIQKYSIPNEVLEGIASMAAFAEETNSKDAQGVIFVSAGNERSGGLNTYPVTTTTWNGKTFHHYQVYFTNMWTSWQTVVQKGSTTEAALKAIKELAVTAAGMAGGPVGIAASLYSGGKNCLNAWKDITGQTPIYGNTKNKVMVDIKYDIYLKYTYYYDPSLGGDLLGCSSQRAYVKRIDTDTYLYTSTGGSRAEETVYPYQTYRSPNYNNPESKAYNYYISGWVESVKGKVYNKTILFSFPSFNWPSDWP